jgi:hypothetical protein
METNFITKLTGFIQDTFHIDFELSTDTKTVFLYFATLHCDYKSKKIKIQLDLEDDYTYEVFYLSKFLAQEGFDAEIVEESEEDTATECAFCINSPFIVEKSEENSYVLNGYAEFSLN